LVPSLAPIIISKKRRRIINAFRANGATSAESARSLGELGLSDSILLEIQKLRGILVEAEPNRFYLDELQERKAVRFRRILVVALIVLAVIIGLCLK